MTHTAHPYGFRLGITRDWRAQWFASTRKQYQELLREDYLIRTFLEKDLADKSISALLLERDRDALTVTVRTTRPGLIIGREGSGVEDLLRRLRKFARKHGLNEQINVRVQEVRYAEQDASLVASSIVDALKRHVHYRRLIKHTVEKVMADRIVKGCRVLVSGRLAGAEIARSEEAKRGKIPLQTLRADIDYSHKEAVLSYGTIGVKVWIYKGDIVRDK